MNNAIQNLLNGHVGMVMLILGIWFFLNAMLTATKKFLDREISRRTADKANVPAWEQTADGMVSKAQQITAKVIEYISANSTALPAPAQAEIAAEKAALDAQK